MKTCLTLFAGLACLGISLSAQASDLSFTISDGTGTPLGTFSGTFSINSSTDMIDGANITAGDPAAGISYTFASTGIDSSTPGAAILTDASGDTLTLNLNGNLNDLAVSTITDYGQSDTFLMLAGGGRYDATGALVTENAVATAPEPSSLLMLSTGALGLVGSFRRRLFNQ